MIPCTPSLCFFGLGSSLVFRDGRNFVDLCLSVSFYSYVSRFKRHGHTYHYEWHRTRSPCRVRGRAAFVVLVCSFCGGGGLPRSWSWSVQNDTDSDTPTTTSGTDRM